MVRPDRRQRCPATVGPRVQDRFTRSRGGAEGRSHPIDKERDRVWRRPPSAPHPLHLTGSKGNDITLHSGSVMRASHLSAICLLCALTLGCAAASRGTNRGGAERAEPALAQIYFWRARPGMSAEYSGYINDVAEPIDREAQRNGAFLSVTTYFTNDTTVPWTHMRVFLLRDSVQLRGLSAALNAAGIRLRPDSVRRRALSEYSATLRDRVGAAVTQIMR